MNKALPVHFKAIQNPLHYSKRQSISPLVLLWLHNGATTND
jgi:hypothetical protein